MITFYTDGSCLGNPGNGGWAYIGINTKNEKFQEFGYEENTTNNRMELTAAIKAIRSLSHGSKCKIVTDSNYVKDGISSWIINWKLNNWITANKKPVKNKDLWIILDDECNTKQVHWSWIKGHSNNKLNNFVDELARKAAEELVKSR